MDKVQKIREEVERIQLYTQSEVLKQVLDYIDEVQEESVSDDLEETIDGYTRKVLERTNCLIGNQPVGEEISKAVKFGANWQKEQDQSTIELAEDHAMLAGMEKMREEMMSKTVDATIGLPYENKNGGYTHLVDVSRPLPVGDNKIAIIFKGE